MTTKYRLFYYDAKGVAEVARMLFALADVEYEDIRFEWGSEEWIKKYRPMSPFGNCPWLEIDDGDQVITIAQNQALTHYLACKFGFSGETPEEDALILMIAETIKEHVIQPLFAFCLDDLEQGKKDAIHKRYIIDQLPTAFTYLEKHLSGSHGGDGWFVGNKISWADVMFAHCINAMPHGISYTPSFENYPKLQALLQRVEEQPRYADWLKRRPDTNMKIYP